MVKVLVLLLICFLAGCSNEGDRRVVPFKSVKYESDCYETNVRHYTAQKYTGEKWKDVEIKIDYGVWIKCECDNFIAVEGIDQKFIPVELICIKCEKEWRFVLKDGALIKEYDIG